MQDRVYGSPAAQLSVVAVVICQKNFSLVVEETKLINRFSHLVLLLWFRDFNLCLRIQ